MSPDTVPRAATRPARARSRTARISLVAGLVALALLVAVIAPAALVRVGAGPMFWHGPEGMPGGPADPGGVEFVDPPSGMTTAVYTFVNHAPLPVTVDRLPEYPDGVDVELLAYPDPGPDALFDPAAEPGRATLKVGAGDVFGVRVHQRWPECTEVAPGSGVTHPAIELRATAVLVPRTVTVALEPPATLRTEVGRSAAGKVCEVVLHVG